MPGGFIGGYADPRENRTYGNFVTVDRGYLSSTFKGFDVRAVPFNGMLQNGGRQVGDFNMQGRTLFTVMDRRYVQVQMDLIANRDRVMLGDRLKFETRPVAGWSIEAALGFRFDLQFPKIMRK